MKRKITLTTCLLLFCTITMAQGIEFKKIECNNIKEAPKFSQPQFLKDEKGDIITILKFGNAAPMLRDWDGDGVKDLLVGEFGANEKSNLIIYKNIGTNEKPNYSSQGTYAKDKNENNMFIIGS